MLVGATLAMFGNSQPNLSADFKAASNAGPMYLTKPQNVNCIIERGTGTAYEPKAGWSFATRVKTLDSTTGYGVDSCAAAAKAKGYQYIGLTNGKICYYGVNPATSTVTLNYLCDKPCADGSGDCGGSGKYISVYKLY